MTEPAVGAGFTRTLARWCADFDDAALTPAAVAWTQHCLLDWLAVAIAGTPDPLVRMLLDEFAPDGRRPDGCTLIGTGRRAAVHDAALVNGAAGHALDYDDVAPRMGGHPTAPIAPAAIAAAEAAGASGRDLIRAFVAGYEIACRIGDACIPSHYVKGFHATGTIGTFGAAAAVANLMRLDAGRSAHALGIAAAQAAGLKSMFGTMTKPLHAGKAAANGLIAARLAARGFTANEDAIECAQGFADTQVPEFRPPEGPIDTSAGFAVQTNLFKYHAACYLTHSTIEAVRALRAQHGLGLADLRSMRIAVPLTHRKVCDILEPKTGLNVKFSIRHLAALALDGRDTADLGLYTDATAASPAHAAARRLVELVPGDTGLMRAATVTITTTDGRELSATANVAVPATDLDAQWDRLVAKARAIVVPVVGAERFEALVGAVQALDSAPDLGALLAAAR